jgi:hypothetical protein
LLLVMRLLDSTLVIFATEYRGFQKLWRLLIRPSPSADRCEFLFRLRDRPGGPAISLFFSAHCFACAT